MGEREDALEAASLLHHDCPCCPGEVRNLYAVAHNLFIRNPQLVELGEAVAAMQPMLDTHFKAVGRG